jgi:hypothetical protein
VFFWPITVDLLRGPTPWDPALSSPQSFYRHTTSGLIRRVRPTVHSAVDSPGRSRTGLVPEWSGRSAPCLADAWQSGRPGSGEPRQRSIWPQRIGAARVVFWPITVDLLRGPTPPDPALNSPRPSYSHTTSGLIRRKQWVIRQSTVALSDGCSSGAWAFTMSLHSDQIWSTVRLAAVAGSIIAAWRMDMGSSVTAARTTSSFMLR